MSQYITTYTNKNTKFNLIDNANKIDLIGKIVVTQKRNNCVFSITNLQGDVFITETPGTIGYKKSNRKNTMSYKELLRVLVAKARKNTEFTCFQLIFKGMCRNKKFIVSSLINLNVKIFSIVSEVYVPKNGCRAKKQRRL